LETAEIRVSGVQTGHSLAAGQDQGNQSLGASLHGSVADVVESRIDRRSRRRGLNGAAPQCAILAFVVYRNGTTMDIGNLSAMWRNVGTGVLTAMLQPKATQCGTGSFAHSEAAPVRTVS